MSRGFPRVALYLTIALVLAGALLISIEIKGPRSANTPATGAPVSNSSAVATISKAASPSSATQSATTSRVASTSSSSFATSSSSAATSTAAPSSAGPIRHVIVIVMENEEYSSVVGNSSAPYQNYLSSHYASAANYYAVSHPSLPNYLAMVGGDTFGVSSDCPPSQCTIAYPSLTSLLDAHGLTWKEYAESMPANCSQTNSPDGLYVPKHNPFVYFRTISGNNGTGSNSSYCSSTVVRFDQFWSDLGSGKLPSFSFVTPNTCDDAHSCPLSTGDHWLSSVVPKIINSSSFSSTALFITYDEGSTKAGFGPNHGGRVFCVLVSPFAAPGYVSEAQYSHYSLLATIEALLKVGNLGQNDASAAIMSDLFATRVFP